VEATGANALVIDTGATAIANSGTFEVNGTGGLILESAVTGDDGLTGGALIISGTLDAEAAFAQDVEFTGTAGKLELADSQGYTGTVSGFSTSGGTSFDLRDIGFVSAGEATFKGTSSGGVLTVTDGTHTAALDLVGSFTSGNFGFGPDSGTGTLITWKQ
jgi:hypothetical protein